MIAAIALVAALSAPAHVSAPATACTTTTTYSHTTSSTGAQTWKWETKRKCGRNYREWLHVSKQYASGAVSDERLYRNEYSYPHYRQHEWLERISAKGVITITITDTSA